MTSKDEFQNTIGDFIIGQIANAESPLTARLAYAMREAIQRYKDEGGDNAGAFCVDATYEDGEFTAEVNFEEDYCLTIMYGKDTDLATVNALYLLLPEVETELCRMAGLMLSEGWVEGYRE